MFLPPVFLQEPVPPGDAFAGQIACGRDVNGDRIPDLVLADATSDDGVDVWLVSGRDGSVIARWSRPGMVGCSNLEFLGDVDGDAVPEIAALLFAIEGSARVEILSVRDLRVLRTIRGEDFGLSIGEALPAGDVDGDDMPDLCVCGWGTPNTCMSSTLVLSGKDDRVIWRIDEEGETEGSGAVALASIGDLDGDNRDDVAVIWRGGPRGTRLALYSGRTGAEMRSTDVETVEHGYSLDGGVDFDGDSLPDILFGAPGAGRGRDALGFVRVYSGRDSHLIQSLQGTALADPHTQSPVWFGEHARFVPDLDGDGTPELLVGAPEEGETTGAAYLCSGKSGAVLKKIEGRLGPFDADGRDRGDYHVGRALGAAGDVDIDGVEDFAVASVPRGESGFGRVRVYSGKTGKLLLSVDRDSLLRGRPPPSTPR